MDFLRTCDTTAQAIPGFEAVAYQAFSVTPTSSADRDAWSPSEHLQAVEAELRRQNRLVAPDARKPWLWLLRPIAVDNVSEPPKDLPAVEGYVLNREHTGVIKALDLARPAPPAPRPGSQGVPGPAGLSTATAANPIEVISALYELLTTSVVALVSHRLLEKHDAVALNFRTFVTRNPLSVNDSDKEKAWLRNSYRLTNVNAYWASSGTLLVSTFTADEPALHCLDEVTDPEAQKAWIGNCVRLAPSGCLVQIVSFDATLRFDAAHAGQRPPRKRSKRDTMEANIERWKAAVTRWLGSKGYTFKDLDQPKSWVRLRLAQLSNSALADSATISQPRDIWWPRALCFYYDATESYPDMEALFPATSNPLNWFATPQSSGYIDPLDLAEQWFLAKAEREKAAEAKRKAEIAEQKVDKGKGPAQGPHLPSSPLNVRSGTSADLHVASGMYPTPPDGVIPGPAASQGTTPGVPAPVTSKVLAQNASHPSINISAPQDSAAASDSQPMASPEFPNENVNTDINARDDLFDDMDEDFGANGVTDADFNFFDDPEVEMQDAPEQLSTDVSETSNNQHPNAVSAPAAKENFLDPMAALENALASASASASRARLEHGPDVHMADAPPTSRIDFAAGDKQITSQENKAQTSEPTRTKSEPLSVAVSDTSLVTESVTPADIAKLTITTHRESAFDPVGFDRRISMSDSKYRNGYFSFPDDKASGTKSKSISGPTTSVTQFKSTTGFQHSPMTTGRTLQVIRHGLKMETASTRMWGAWSMMQRRLLGRCRLGLLGLRPLARGSCPPMAAGRRSL